MTNDKQLANWFYCQVKTCIKETTVIIIVVVVGFKIGWGEPSLRYVDANINLFMTIQLKCDEMMTTNGKFFLACQRIPKSSQWKYCRTHFVYTAKMFAFGALANRLMALPFSGICSFCGHHYDVSVFFNSAFEKQLPLTWGIMFGCVSQRWPIVDRALQSILFVHTVDVIHNINCDWLHHITRWPFFW